MAIEVNPQTFLHTIVYAIKDRLRVGFPKELFQFTLMPDNPTVKELSRVVVKKPFLGLGLSGLTIGDMPRYFKGKASFNLFLITQNNTGVVTPDLGDPNTSYVSRYLGDDLGIGLFGMIAVAGPLLQGFTIDGIGSVEIEHVMSVRVEEWADEACAVAAITFHVAFNVGLPGASQDSLNEFLTLNAAWSVNGDTEVLANDTPLQIATS